MAQERVRRGELESTWRKTVARQQECGATVRQFCREAGCKESAFYYWKRELRRRDGQGSGDDRQRQPQQSPALLPVTIGPTVPAPIEVALPGGVTVRVADSCDAATLRMVFAALETA
jgi:transposase-like protein